jgi:hypothetical protein
MGIAFGDRLEATCAHWTEPGTPSTLRPQELPMSLVQPNTLVPPLDGGSPSPVHLALDRLTVITIQVQQLHRQVRQRAIVDPNQVDDVLGPVEAELRDLGAILSDLRDRI